MRILVFCSDLLPYPGLPTSGGGLRCWQLIESLRALGHEPIVSMPLFTYLGKQFANRISGSLRADAWNLENQDELVERHRPDAVLFTSSWIVDRLGRDHECLMLYDLHGPQMLEQLYKEEHNTAINAQVKVEKLAKADFVCCAGQRQRHYFFPFLLLAGHDLRSLEEFAVVPIACSPQLPVHEFPSATRFVMGGGFFPWQDPSTGLRAIREVLGSEVGRSAEARIFGRSHGITGADDNAFDVLCEELAGIPNVSFEGFVPREELIEEYRTASVALDLHARNPERELAFTTRTVEYLWCGLPVVHNDFDELADAIRDYDAGWTVDPGNLSAVCQTLADIIASPDEVRRKGRNAQALVRDRLTYSRAIGPLAEFLAAPRTRQKRSPAKVIPMDRYHQLLGAEVERREIVKSRAFRTATTLASWKRHWIGPKE